MNGCDCGHFDVSHKKLELECHANIRTAITSTKCPCIEYRPQATARTVRATSRERRRCGRPAVWIGSAGGLGRKAHFGPATEESIAKCDARGHSGVVQWRNPLGETNQPWRMLWTTKHRRSWRSAPSQISLAATRTRTRTRRQRADSHEKPGAFQLRASCHLLGPIGRRQ